MGVGYQLTSESLLPLVGLLKWCAALSTELIGPPNIGGERWLLILLVVLNATPTAISSATKFCHRLVSFQQQRLLAQQGQGGLGAPN